jgi:hypothetical protein
VRVMLAAGISDNTPHGYNYTFLFPMILFVVIAGALYLIFSRPHRVPGHGPLARPSEPTVADAEAARRAAAAAGYSTAPGGGAFESEAEAAGAHRAAVSDTLSGNVADQTTQTADQETADSPGADDGEAGE